MHSTCALSASRRSAARTDRGNGGSSCDEFLAAEPADLVELVHAHVDEDAAAAGAECRGRRFAVPLIAGDEIQRAQFAVGDTLPQALQRRHEAAPVGDLQLHVVPLGDGGGFARLVPR